MSKLWKRLVMLGALISCMATAAWAGNMSIDVTEGYVYPLIEETVDGCYMTSISGINQLGWDGYEEIEYHFDKDGRIAWEKCDVNYHDSNFTTYDRFIYDEAGNLIKRSSIGETYTYDEQGRMLTGIIENYGGAHQKKRELSYEDGKTIWSLSYDGEIGFQREYILNEKQQIIKATEYTRARDSLDLEVSRVVDYTYDENDNLVSYELTYIDDYNDIETTEKKTYIYDDSGKCIESIDGNGYCTEYKYDSYGNLVAIVSGDYELCRYTYEKLDPVQDEAVYSDVADKNEYFYDSVNWATKTGITNGTSDTTFSPELGCTRAQMVTFLWRAAGSPEPEMSENPFTDVVAESYYEKAVLWAIENNITNGVGENLFAPEATCTRAQIVTFIYRAAGEPDAVEKNDSFTDVADDAYYAKAVTWAVEKSITNGMGDGLFAPENTCTRAQGVTFLYRGIGLY